MVIHKELKKITKKFIKNYDWELVETPVYEGKVTQTRFFDSPEKAVNFFADPPNLRAIFALRFAAKDKA
jgi:hypothetical protein